MFTVFQKPKFGPATLTVAAVAVALAATLATGPGCSKSEETPPAPMQSSSATQAAQTGEIDAAILAAFAALPAQFDSKDNPASDAKIKLGRHLYYEKRLSKNHDLSCNSCHMLSAYGVDNKPVSPGHKGQLGVRNSPTVYNAAGHMVQFWDGRAANVEEQAKGPILNPVEMAMPNEARVVETLKSIPEYVEAFNAAFPEVKESERISYDNMAKAIGAFERRLVTPSRWDQYLTGNKTALTDEEKAGFRKFGEIGCFACHTGVLVGANTFQKAGQVVPWPNQKDKGRIDISKDPQDEMKFKVPSLRNVEKTAPYFHDGSVANLEDAVRTMGKHQLGKTLSDDDVKSIVTWLKSLTGPLPPADYIAEPTPFPSTEKTPKPDPS